MGSLVLWVHPGVDERGSMRRVRLLEKDDGGVTPNSVVAVTHHDRELRAELGEGQLLWHLGRRA